MAKLNDSATKLNQAYQLKDSAKFQAEMSKLNDAALNLKMSDAFKLNTALNQAVNQDALGLRGGSASHQ
jgi:putative salt-induced outer membrane protein YdiY